METFSTVRKLIHGQVADILKVHPRFPLKLPYGIKFRTLSTMYESVQKINSVWVYPSLQYNTHYTLHTTHYTLHTTHYTLLLQRHLLFAHYCSKDTCYLHTTSPGSGLAAASFSFSTLSGSNSSQTSCTTTSTVMLLHHVMFGFVTTFYYK